MQPIEGITPEMLWTFFVVLVGLATLVVLGYKVVEIVRKEQEYKRKKREQPEDKLADDISSKILEKIEPRFNAIDRKLANDKTQIEAHAREIAELRKRAEGTEQGMRAVCKGMLVLMNNAKGNATDQEIDDAARAFTNYLADK